MAKGITLPIASDTRAAARGLKDGLIEPLEDASDTLKRVAEAGDRAGNDLEAGFRDAQRATERYEADYKALTRTISTESKRQSSAVTSGAEHSAREASETLNEVKQESLANISETVSSFNGDMSSAIGAIQGTLGGLVPALGPLGIAIGAAGAIGFGLIQKGIEDSEAKTEAFREAVGELTTELIDAGKDGSVSIDYLIGKLKALAAETDPAKDSLIKLRRTAQDAHSNYRDLAQAFAGNAEKLDDLISKTRAGITANEDAARSANMHTQAGQDQYRTAILQSKHLGTYAEKLEEARAKVKAAQEAEEAWKEAGGPDLEQKAQATENWQSALSSALTAAGSDWEEYATKEGGISLDKYATALETKVQGIRNYQANLVKASADMSADARDYLVSLGTDAAPLLQKFVNAPLAQRERVAGDWDTLGKAARGAFTGGLGRLPDIPAPKVGRPVIPVPDMSGLDAYLARQRTVKVTAEVFTRNGRRIE